MPLYDFGAYVMPDGFVLCIECISHSGETPRQMEEAGGYPIFVGSEWDCYPICDSCGERQEYVSLTYFLCPGCQHRERCLEDF